MAERSTYEESAPSRQTPFAKTISADTRGVQDFSLQVFFSKNHLIAVAGSAAVFSSHCNCQSSPRQPSTGSYEHLSMSAELPERKQLPKQFYFFHLERLMLIILTRTRARSRTHTCESYAHVCVCVCARMFLFSVRTNLLATSSSPSEPSSSPSEPSCHHFGNDAQEVVGTSIQDMNLGTMPPSDLQTTQVRLMLCRSFK